MFKAGEYVIKPNTGICRIKEIVTMNLGGGGEKDYYLLQPINDSRSTLYVTVDADRTKLRLAMSKEEAEIFIREIPNIEAAWIANDKLREQRYKDAFRSNEASDLVAIIKNMHIRGKERMAAGKKTTATDIKYFQQAEEILCSELAFSLDIKIEEVKNVIAQTIEL